VGRVLQARENTKRIHGASMKLTLLCVAFIAAILIGAYVVSGMAEPVGEYWEVER